MAITTLGSFNYFLLATSLSFLITPFEPIGGALLVQKEEKTADLSTLINETLAINNKTATSAKDVKLKDDWTFDMVEYDLMEFLKDLSARYQMVNKSDPNRSQQLEGEESQLEGKVSLPPTTTQTSVKAITNQPIERRQDDEPEVTVASKKSTPVNGYSQLPTSLAPLDDHNLAESNWQYGIFDRFTRPKSTTTTVSPDLPPLVLDENGQIEARNFNSEECGLRYYDEHNHFFPESQQDEQSEASKDLNQRRQKFPFSHINNFKKQVPIESSFSSSSFEDELNRKRVNAAYDSYKKNSEPIPESDSYSPNNDASVGSSEFNLENRRQWLQQQLGNTLQMLGYNSTNSQSLSDYFNETTDLIGRRENMMKKSGKSVEDQLDLISTGEPLNTRQDDLTLEPRVIGGSDARLGDSPWSVSLQALVSRPGTGSVEYRHYCGGTIISEHYVLTAAHCLDFMVGRESRLFVVIGDLNWRMSAASLYGRRFSIEKLIIHSGYKSTAFGHDIGLIKVKDSMRPIKVNGRYIVNSVCLPDRNVEHTGEAELVGWGLFSNRNEMADSLQIANVPILPRQLCVDLYRRRTGLIQWLIGIELITEKQVCAGTFGRGICQGDSGSALVFNERAPKRVSNDDKTQLRQNKRVGGRGEESRATVIGVVAFGGIRRCSYQSLPGVYMQTSKYMDWIVPRIQGVAV